MVWASCAPARALSRFAAKMISPGSATDGCRALPFGRTVIACLCLRPSLQHFPCGFQMTPPMFKAAELQLLVDPSGDRFKVRRKRQGWPIVYVSANHSTRALEYALRSLSQQSSLVVSSDDRTVPAQRDLRWKSWSRHHEDLLVKCATSARAAYFENCVQQDSTFSAMPLGVLSTPISSNVRVAHTTLSSTHELRVLFAHRIRDGEQWSLRKAVTFRAKTDWLEFSTVVDKQVKKRDFRRLLRTHAFTACVGGGGVDPCPKVFDSLLAGSIPIVDQRASELFENRLPLFVIADWQTSSLDVAELFEFWEATKRAYSGPDGWLEVIRKLDERYWVDIITPANLRD